MNKNITFEPYQAQKHKIIWDQFVRQSKNGHFMFCRDYMDYHNDRFDDFSLLVFKNNTLVSLLPANIVGKKLFSHQGLTFGGFITNNKMGTTLMLSIFEALKFYLKKNSIDELVYKSTPNIYHKQPSNEDLYGLFRMNADLFRVDVSTTIDLNNPITFGRGKITGINKAQREGVEIRPSKEYGPFFEMITNQLSEKYRTTPTHTAQEMEKLAEKFPENIKLFTAHKNNNMIAGCIIYINHQVIHTQYLSSNDFGRKLRAVDLTIGYLIEKYSTFDYFDFGISNENNGQTLNSNLISQKEEFGGRAIIHQFFRMSF